MKQPAFSLSLSISLSLSLSLRTLFQSIALSLSLSLSHTLSLPLLPPFAARSQFCFCSAPSCSSFLCSDSLLVALLLSRFFAAHRVIHTSSHTHIFNQPTDMCARNNQSLRAEPSPDKSPLDLLVHHEVSMH